MAGNRNDSGPRDRTTINMNEDFEVRYWSKELGVSVQQLKSAMRSVGDKTDDIRKELKNDTNRAWRS